MQWQNIGAVANCQRLNRYVRKPEFPPESHGKIVIRLYCSYACTQAYENFSTVAAVCPYVKNEIVGTDERRVKAELAPASLPEVWPQQSSPEQPGVPVKVQAAKQLMSEFIKHIAQ